jgi:hypothetical protein
MNKILVSKAAINVGTATNPNDFIFNSDHNTFKILEQGTLIGTLTNSGTSIDSINKQITQSNKFGFGFCKFSNGRVGSPGNKASDADFWFTGFNTDGAYVFFDYVNNTGGNYVATFSYIICESPS